MRTCAIFFWVILPLAHLAAQAQAQEEVRQLKLRNEVVCRVNNDAISKLQVEERMGYIPAKIEAMRENLEQAGQLTKENEAKLDDMYRDPFRDALRSVVRDTLLLQSAKSEKVPVDEKTFQKKYHAKLEELRAAGVLGSKGLTPGEVQQRMRENALRDAFRSKFYTVLDQPSRPEVQKYFIENAPKYQRKPGVKVRVIRVDRVVVNRFTGKATVRDNALDVAEEMRKDIVEYGGDFKEMARERSDDTESRARGGLIQLDPKDFYIDADSYNAQLAGAIRGLKVGAVSKVFEFGKSSWAFALLEDRREAGPAPLEGDLYDDIYNELLDRKTRKQEDEWFRKTLEKSLVQHVVEGKGKPLPMEFFFPDEKKEPAQAANAPRPQDAPAGPRVENAPPR